MPLTPWPKLTIRLMKMLASPPIVQRVFSGNNRQDAFSIKDTFATDSQNISSKNFPMASVRDGYSRIGTALAARILGLGIWKQAEIQAISNGVWYKNIAGVYTSLKTGLSASANWSFANFHGSFSGINLIGANGVDPMQVYDGTTVSALATAPAGGNYIEQFGERVWCLVGNDLHGCTLGNASNWTTFNQNDSDPYIKTLETPAGEIPNGLKAGNNHLTIFFPNAIQELYGYVPSDFRSVPVTYNVGAASNQAVTSVEGTFYFIHKTGFYKYSGGTLPMKDFSKPIQDYINRINPAQIAKCSCGNNGKYVYLSIPLDSATDPDTIIEYNTEFGVFNVWKGYAPLNMNTMLGTLYIGGVEGEVRQVGGSTSDNGAAINWFMTSKPHAAGSLAQKLQWKRAWVTAKVPTGSTMSVALSKSDSGNSDFVTVQAIAPDNVLESSRIFVPTTVVSYANWVRYNISGTGPADIKEFARDEEHLNIV
jgi:hypothetical protein